MTPSRVVVVGGGISGLAAAWALTGGPEHRSDAPTVVVLEASSSLGGPLRSDPLAGRAVDMGPDGFLGRRPEAIELCREVGLADALVPIGARGASVWARGRLRALPEGHAMGIPTRFWPTARSGVLGWRGLVGLARDAVLPRPDVRGPIGDRSIGPLVARKLGHQVVDVARRPPHRRHPCRFGRRHVRRGDLPTAPGGGAAPRRSHAGAPRRGPPTGPRRAATLLVARGRPGVTGAGARVAPARAGGRRAALGSGRPARACRRRVGRLVRRPNGRGGRRRARHARTRHRDALASPR